MGPLATNSGSPETVNDFIQYSCVLNVLALVYMLCEKLGSVYSIGKSVFIQIKLQVPFNPGLKDT